MTPPVSANNTPLSLDRTYELSNRKTEQPTPAATPKVSEQAQRLCQSVASDSLDTHKSKFLEPALRSLLQEIVDDNLVPAIEDQSGFPREGEARTIAIKYLSPYITESAQSQAPVPLSDLSEKTRNAYLEEAARETVSALDTIGADGQVSPEEKQQLKWMAKPYLKQAATQDLETTTQDSYDNCVEHAAQLEAEVSPQTPANPAPAAPPKNVTEIKIPSVLGIDRAMETSLGENALSAFSIRRIQNFA